MTQSNGDLKHLSPIIFISVVIKSNERQGDPGDPAVKLFLVVAAKNGV
jgi:hypothetical protein